ncbi:MAG: (d)CMP kinase [Pseudomonadota bacterium]|nr:(d)CMP kinase [Pseudomonadota bacterium]
MIITIDGPAGSGKGTIAAALAEKYKMAYFDTGMVYRAVGLQMVLDGASLEDEDKAASLAEKLTFPQMIALSENKDFRSDTGSRAASIVSAYPKVRAALLTMQKNFALNPVFADGSPASGAIYDGRDTGTVICPQADLKLYVIADLTVRAQRRCRDLNAAGHKISFEQVYEDMKARDDRDMNRSTAPLKPAPDAVIIDTSAFQLEDSLRVIEPLIDKKLAELSGK